MNTSGNATSRAPLRAASAISAQALSTVACVSRNTGAVWTAATFDRGKSSIIVLSDLPSGDGGALAIFRPVPGAGHADIAKPLDRIDDIRVTQIQRRQPEAQHIG